ncbi:RimJ/RimL family protein N-acetyltransferase [Enterococcus sp. PF1-24]|uniref:GNAT family N-acetyltransferase n=1 Tax=unclassified Enterococcus TaxID=2608891 RepID=UPI002475EEFF|nr:MULTISPECIES: GNAT family protein [unclassified Enterococcus]MDH6363296.1 RimJ/RimL family protein N-acetyltransferase [Enterococcus sp. PFB1-1]MDH6400403.1 RimJ/RimL family protein N-acetyltransferase [Enterococcus sp. PF1-24]
MSEDLDITIREVLPDDAAALLAVSQQLGKETDFLIMDEAGMDLLVADLALQLELLYHSENNLLLAAWLGDEMIATASVRGDDAERLQHIGEVGISVLKEYWGLGLGHLLLEELIAWAQESQLIYRLELTVQVRNQRAVALYQHLGFAIEGTLARGARSSDGEFLDVYLMSKLIN